MLGCRLALKPVLIEEGVYNEYCTEKEVDRGVGVCFEQELRLNFMFTAAAVATNVSQSLRIRSTSHLKGLLLINYRSVLLS